MFFRPPGRLPFFPYGFSSFFSWSASSSLLHIINSKTSPKRISQSYRKDSCKRTVYGCMTAPYWPSPHPHTNTHSYILYSHWHSKTQAPNYTKPDSNTQRLTLTHIDIQTHSMRQTSTQKNKQTRDSPSHTHSLTHIPNHRFVWCGPILRIPRGIL